MDNNQTEFNQNNNNNSSYMGNIQQFSNDAPSMTPYNQNKRPVNFPNQQMNSYPNQGFPPQGQFQQGQFQQGQFQQGYPQQGQQFQKPQAPQGYTQQPMPQNLMNQRYVGGQSYPNPTAPAPETAKKKYTVQIISIVAAFLIISLGVLAVFMNWGPFKQKGGKASVNELFDAYIQAVNNRDVDAYMQLIPKAERISEEKKSVKSMMASFPEDLKNMTLVMGSSKDLGDGKKKAVSEKLNNMSTMPVRVNSVQEVDATLKYGDEEKHVKFTVIECGDNFFIDDVTLK